MIKKDESGDEEIAGRVRRKMGENGRKAFLPRTPLSVDLYL